MPSNRTARRLLAPLALAGLAGLLVAGCGDDGEDALTEEEFVEQANEICATGDEELEEAAGELSGSAGGETPGDDDIVAFMDVFEENVLGQLDDIEALEGPDDLEAEVDEIIEEARTLVSDLADEVREDPAALFNDQGEDPFADTDARLEELGLDECAD